MDNFRLYTQATALSIAAVAAPLLISPKLVAWTVSTDPHVLSPWEDHLSRTFGVVLFLAAFLVLVCSGELKHVYAGDRQADSLPDHKSNTATLTLISTLVYHFVLAVIMYRDGWNPALSSTVMTIGGGVHLVLGVAGLLVTVFRTDGKISKRTGADKRTSGFPFKNSEAAKKHK